MTALNIAPLKEKKKKPSIRRKICHQKQKNKFTINIVIDAKLWKGSKPV